MEPYDYFEGNFDQPRNVVLEHRTRINRQIHARFALRDTVDPLSISVNEFIRLYRMPQHEVVQLVNILAPYVPRRSNPSHTPLLTKLLVALSFYGNGSYQRMQGRSADLAVSQKSVSRYIKEITGALNHPEIITRFIRFPMTGEERAAAMARNERLGMPRVIGYLDGTLVKIVPPPREMERQSYFCRKGFTAINAQIICDADLVILNVNARYPGCCNDRYIWNGSAARTAMEQAYREDRCWLLGDGGYFRAPWLHIPLLHAEAGTPEYDYTELHMHCRNAVERCIGVLKGRWRCLGPDKCLTYRPDVCGKIINACCVLHNFCVQQGVPNPRPIVDDVDVELPDDDELMPPAEVARLGLAEQNYLVNYAHQRKLRRMELYGF